MDAPYLHGFGKQLGLPLRLRRLRAAPPLAIVLGMPSSSVSSGRSGVIYRAGWTGPKDIKVIWADPSPWLIFLNPFLWSWIQRGKKSKPCLEMALRDSVIPVEVDGAALQPCSMWPWRTQSGKRMPPEGRTLRGTPVYFSQERWPEVRIYSAS